MPPSPKPVTEANPWGIHCRACTVEDPCLSCAEQLAAEWDYTVHRDWE